MVQAVRCWVGSWIKDESWGTEVHWKAEIAPFSFSLKDGHNSIEIRNKAICYVPDLWGKIEEMLAANDNEMTGYTHTHTHTQTLGYIVSQGMMGASHQMRYGSRLVGITWEEASKWISKYATLNIPILPVIRVYSVSLKLLTPQLISTTKTKLSHWNQKNGGKITNIRNRLKHCEIINIRTYHI